MLIAECFFCNFSSYTGLSLLGEIQKGDVPSMRKMNLILAATLALGSAAFTQTTASGSVKDDIQKDRQDLRQDRHELNQLESRVQQDKQRLQADRTSHASKAQIQADRNQLHQDEQQVKRLKTDMRHDKQDIKRDRRQLRHRNGHHRRG